MKKLLQIICLFAVLASVASAQTAVCVGPTCKSSTAAQDPLTVQAAQLDNRATCVSNGLPPTCTQANLNTKCPAGGCGTIYPLTTTGYQQYALDKMFSGYFDFLDAKIKSQNIQDLDAAGVANGGEIATNTVCANAGLSNVCTKFAAACMTLKGTADCK